ncbi:MAG: acyltransferase [Bacteroidaceae bacterium]|nr:acyltransferase [Bacteroidaceae bacterium]
METRTEIAPTTAFADTKPHYELLDGLRGAVALMVVWYHIFEGFAFAGGGAIETFNHGHIGVDFFFMLSGFVISYAYDDRWQANGKKHLGTTAFFRRRLIRLHPMLIMGAIIGLTAFLIQGGVKWDESETAVAWSLVALICTVLFIPAYHGASYEIRGNGEMFPLNGPSWSLFFEYIGNIIYALAIRRMSNKTLCAFTLITGILWGWFFITDMSGYDMLGVGWALDRTNFIGGLLRMTFPFSVGMLIARNFKPVKVPGIFWISIAALFALFSVPYIPSDVLPYNGISLNSIYEMLCVICAFPLIVWLAASGSNNGNISRRICTFFGDISYPLYIVHYPIMYLFYAWLIKNKLYTLSETWPVVISVMTLSVLIAYTCLKIYDEPVRRWLTKRFINKS